MTGKEKIDDARAAVEAAPSALALDPPRASVFGEFLSAESESRSFGRMRHRVLRTMFRQTFGGARFRVSLVVVLTAVLWGGMFWMFVDGFQFMRATITNPETYSRIVGGLFGIFFAALMVMLVFSAGVILYGALFRTREITFLLTIPARTERVFLHKFQETIVLSSWGFVLLGSPMLLAYGFVVGSPWYYYVLLLPFIFAFVYIPVAVGAIVCLVVVHRIPGNRSAALVAGAVLLLGIAGWMAWNLLAGPRDNLLTPSWFQEVLGRLQLSDHRLLPSWWLSTGVLAAAESEWRDSVLFLALMISNALFFRQLALWTAGGVYRAAYSGLYGVTSPHRRPHAIGFDRLLMRSLGFLPTTTRLMMLKDLRLFRRDPLQWSQFLVFLGLLVLYFFNIRRFTYDMSSIAWVNLVSFLNLSVVGLLLSTFTTRFIYPMISLEGRRFWILGLVGVRRETILWSKFLYAVGGSIVPCSSLVLLSDLMLGVSGLVIVGHQLTCFVLCFGLAGIAVGLGAWLPNLREESPARIAAGFGGTLTLVVSTLYILVVVLLTALPTHFYLVADYARLARDANSPPAAIDRWLIFWLAAGIGASLVLGAIATVVPLRIGLRAFRRIEFR